VTLDKKKEKQTRVPYIVIILEKDINLDEMKILELENPLKFST